MHVHRLRAVFLFFITSQSVGYTSLFFLLIGHHVLFLLLLLLVLYSGLILLMRGFLLGRVWAMRPCQEKPQRDPSE